MKPISPFSSQRDPRLDFFRGLAMLIIFVAHVPTNWLAQFIPARFGYSDAAEMFVFLSGFAASIAFGGTFRRAGFAMGTARIAYRCWQIYVAHLGLFFSIATICVIGNMLYTEPDYISRLNLYPFFDETQAAMVGLFTLTYVPNYFDILPMYIGALTLVPVVVALARVNVLLVPAFCFTLYLATWIFDLHFPAEFNSDRPWFFNPFGWQLLFFTGFTLGSGWIKPPAPSPTLFAVCCVFVLLCVPLNYWPIWGQFEWLKEIRSWLQPFAQKTNFGLLRWLHFLALAYIAVTAIKGREWLLRTRVAAPIVKTGQQALPVFLLSMSLAYVGGIFLDQVGRSAWSWTLVNALGFAILIGAAYMFSWFKSAPWKRTQPRQLAKDELREDPNLGKTWQPAEVGTVET